MDQKRKEQRILDNLSPEMLKDIGCYRNSTGEYKRNW